MMVKRARQLPGSGTKLTLILVGALPVALLLSAMILAVLNMSGETTLVGRRGGPWRSVPTWQAQLGALAILLPLTGLFLWRTSRAVLTLAIAARRDRRPDAAATGLAPGEPILWQGRQGWRGLSLHRLLLMALAAVGPILFLIWMGNVWGDPDPLFLKLFWTAGALIVLGGSVAMAAISAPRALRRCYRDLLGTMAVTDRRIAWLSPWRRQVYREIEGATLAGAAIVERTARHGWIALIQRRGGDVRDIDLKGVPAPDNALAAIQRLVESGGAG